MIYFSRDNTEEVPDIPREVAVCPICGADLIIEDIDEWEDDGRVTECGLHINCSTEPDIDGKEWVIWFRTHWSMPYVDWLPLNRKVYKWFDEHYRIVT